MVSLSSLIDGRARTVLVGMLGVVVGLMALALMPEEAGAQVSEDFVVRVAARLNENGRVEFGIQRLDADEQPRLLHLEDRRYFPRSVDHHRWLKGWPSLLLQAPYYDSEDYSDANVPQTARGVSARVVARRNPDSDRIEFAIEPKLDASQLPNSDVAAYGSPLIGQRRFWSDSITHNRWLYGSPLQFTRVWSNAGTLEAEPTLEDDGSVSANPNSGASPVTETAAGCLEAIALNSEAMVSEECASILATYCVDHQEVEYCREHYSPEEKEEEPASTPVMPQTATSTSANRCLEIIVAGGDQSTLPDGLRGDAGAILHPVFRTCLVCERRRGW